jgi:hypothetical protein
MLLKLAHVVLSEIRSGADKQMTLRIEQVQGRIRLSGEFRFQHLDQVKTELERGESPIVLDLEELDLVDLEGVRFLNACESAGMLILHCSPYIREWMLQERRRSKEHSEQW